MVTYNIFKILFENIISVNDVTVSCFGSWVEEINNYLIVTSKNKKVIPLVNFLCEFQNSNKAFY